MWSPPYYLRQVRLITEREVRRKSTAEIFSFTVADHAEKFVEEAVNSDDDEKEEIVMATKDDIDVDEESTIEEVDVRDGKEDTVESSDDEHNGDLSVQLESLIQELEKN